MVSLTFLMTYTRILSKHQRKLYQIAQSKKLIWITQNPSKRSHTVTNASMKYALLGVSQRNAIEFDIGKTLDPTGNSTSFILYTGARISSIITKFENAVKSGEFAPEPEHKLLQTGISSRMIHLHGKYLQNMLCHLHPNLSVHVSQKSNQHQSFQNSAPMLSSS